MLYMHGRNKQQKSEEPCASCEGTHTTMQLYFVKHIPHINTLK